VVRGGDDAGADPLGDHGLDHEPPDLGLHAREVADADALGVLGADQQRVGVGEFVEELRVARARVDYRRQPVGRQQQVLAAIVVDQRVMHVAARVGGHGVLGPAPVDQLLLEELELARGRVEPAPRHAVELRGDGVGATGERKVGGVEGALGDGLLRAGDLGVIEILHLGLVRRVVVARDLHHAVAAHVLQRGVPLRLGLLGQAGHGVLEHPAVVLLEPDLLARAVWRLVVLADAERPVGVRAPGDLDPELVLLPHLARVGLVGELHLPAHALHRDALHRLAEAQPAPGVGLVGVGVVALRASRSACSHE